MKQEKIDKLLLDCYTELYKHSTPSVDFNELLFSQKIIPFNDYEIEHSKFENILNDMIKKYKLKGYKIQQFKNTIYMGCSPKIKENDILSNNSKTTI